MKRIFIYIIFLLLSFNLFAQEKHLLKFLPTPTGEKITYYTTFLDKTSSVEKIVELEKTISRNDCDIGALPGSMCLMPEKTLLRIIKQKGISDGKARPIHTQDIVTESGYTQKSTNLSYIMFTSIPLQFPNYEIGADDGWGDNIIVDSDFLPQINMERQFRLKEFTVIAGKNCARMKYFATKESKAFPLAVTQEEILTNQSLDIFNFEKFEIKINGDVFFDIESGFVLYHSLSIDIKTSTADIPPRVEDRTIQMAEGMLL